MSYSYTLLNKLQHETKHILLLSLGSAMSEVPIIRSNLSLAPEHGERSVEYGFEVILNRRGLTYQPSYSHFY